MELKLEQLAPRFFSIKKESEIWNNELVFQQEELVQIVAPSGSGKSSLIHFIYGLREDYSGKIWLGAEKITGLDIEKLSAIRQDRISIVFQDLRLFPHISAEENIEVKRKLKPFHPAARIHEMAEKLGIRNKLSQKAGQCSYGEQQRIAIIRALMQPFDFLLLDEPFSHLDDANTIKAFELIQEECTQRKAAMILADLRELSFFDHAQLYHL